MIEWTSSFISAVCVVWILSALTMPAGIGGGILFVPIMRILGGLAQGASSALSQVLITGSALGSILFQLLWQMRFPEEPMLAQPYYVVLMLPALLSGSLIGVYLSNLFPAVVCLMVLVCLCAVSSVLILNKGFETYRKENKIKHAKALLINEQIAIPSPIRAADRGISMVSIKVGINVHPETGMYYEIEERPPPIENSTALPSPSGSVRSYSNVVQHPRIEKPEEDHKLRSNGLMQRLIKSTPTFVAFTGLYWTFFALCTLVRGSRRRPSFTGLTPCGAGYWSVAGIQAAVGLLVALAVGSREIKLIGITFLTGLLATVSGASGGIILNPILLERGLDPQQTSATSTIMTLAMASCSALDFLASGRLEPLAASLMGVTLIGSAIGMTLVTWLVKALGRQSILVFLLGGMVIIGGLLLVYIGVKDVLLQYQEGSSPFAFGYLC